MSEPPQMPAALPRRSSSTTRGGLKRLCQNIVQYSLHLLSSWCISHKDPRPTLLFNLVICICCNLIPWWRSPSTRLTWMCCCVMSQGLCASSLLSVCRLRSLVGACSRPLSQLSSPPASRNPALCCCTRYRHWCRAAACEEKGQKERSHPRPSTVGRDD